MDLTTVLVAFFTALPATLAAVFGLITSLKNKAVLKEVHELSNSAMGIQLGINAELSQWKADNSPGDAKAQMSANVAQKMYRDHMAKQTSMEFFNPKKQ